MKGCQLLTKQTKVNMIVGLLTLEHSCPIPPHSLSIISLPYVTIAIGHACLVEDLFNKGV